MHQNTVRPPLAPWGYLLVTFGFSWLVWSIPVLMRFNLIPHPGPGTLAAVTMSITAVGAFGPMVGALVMSRHERGKGAALAHIKRVFMMRVKPRWYLAPVVFIGLIELAVWALSLCWGEAPIASFLPTPWIIPIYLVMMVYFGGGQEEIGWRGFALDRLLARHNDLVASIILGTVWAWWHIPLWFMTGTSQAFMPFGAFWLMTVALSITMTWIYVGSGRSLFIGMWTHGVANALMAIIPIFLLTGGNQYRFWIFSSCLLVAGLVLSLIRGIGCRSGGIVGQ